MTRVVITAMLAWLAVGVWAVPARAAVDIHIGIPGVVIRHYQGWLMYNQCALTGLQHTSVEPRYHISHGGYT
jgi:hypothetical protein